MCGDLPDFEAPPINEVAMGVRFAPIQGLVLAHFGLFWSSLKDEFGKSEEAMPLGPFDELPMSTGGGPLPRTWLIHNDEQFLIQLQPNLFFFNWRRRDEAQSYPRYSTIKPLFQDYLQRFMEFLVQEELPGPEEVSCDLTYVNVIPKDQYEGSNDGLGSLFPDLTWRQEGDRFLQTPKNQTWQATFDLPDAAGELTAKIQSALRLPGNLPVLRFELTARSKGLKLPMAEIEHWFDLAHRVIVLSFVDLTSDELQRKVWKRVDGAT